MSSHQRCSSMPGEDDDCESDTNKWFYNKQQGACENFKYGDCPRNQNIFDSEKECTETCKDVGKGGQKTSGGGFSAPGSGRHKRPAKPKGSEEEETGIGTEPADKPKGGGGVKGGPKTKPLPPSRPMRPARVRPTLPPPGKPDIKGACWSRPRRGKCEGDTEKWWFDGTFRMCDRVKQWECSNHGSFFESCTDCMNKCNRRNVSRCTYWEAKYKTR